jgi:hypothetical protein
VRQHHAGAADADALGDGGDGGDEDFRRRADNGLVAVMLGQPEAVVAQRLAVLRQRDGVADGGAVRAADYGDGLVEDGEAQRRLLPKVGWLRCSRRCGGTISA